MNEKEKLKNLQSSKLQADKKKIIKMISIIIIAGSIFYGLLYLAKT